MNAQAKDPLRPLQRTVWLGLALFALAALLSTLGCGAPGYIRAEAVEGTIAGIASRHDAYVQGDETLSPLQKRANLRDTELLLKLVKEAQRPQETPGE